MTLLRRLLKVQAALWVLGSLGALIAPGWLVEDVLGQPPLDTVWIRAAAVMGLVLALLMVLVAQRGEVWWWSWAFAALDVGTATVFAAHALLGAPDGAAGWPWWSLAATNAAFGAGLLVGMGRAGQERPFT
jgi:hypothetical protein